MLKNTILDEVLFIYDMLEISNLSLVQIYSEIKKHREQNNIDVGNFDCLKSYIHWSILDNSRGRGKNIFTIKINNNKELVERKIN
jgi:hypothetical protein